MLEKIIIMLNFFKDYGYKCIWLIGTEHDAKKKSITFGLFLPVLSRQNWKKLDDKLTTGEILKDVRNAGKNTHLELFVTRVSIYQVP